MSCTGQRAAEKNVAGGTATWPPPRGHEGHFLPLIFGRRRWDFGFLRFCPSGTPSVLRECVRIQTPLNVLRSGFFTTQGRQHSSMLTQLPSGAQAPRRHHQAVSVRAVRAVQANAGRSLSKRQELQQKLASATSAAQVLELSSGAALDHIHAVTALHRLALHSSSAAQRSQLAADGRLLEITVLLSTKTKQLNAQGVANSLWACAKLAPQVCEQSLVNALVAAASQPSLWTGAAPQAVANAAWAHAKLSPGAPNQKLLRVLASASMSLDFRPQELSNLLWAFGSTGTMPKVDGWGDAMWAAIGERLQLFSAVELSICLWSLARLGLNSAELDRAAEQLARKAGDCDAQAAANGLWAMATLGAEASQAVSALVERAHALLPQMQRPQALCNVLMACATLSHDPGPERVGAFVTRALALSAALNAQDVVGLCESLIQLRYAPTEAGLATLAQSLDKEKLRGFSILQLNVVVGAFKRFDYADDALSERMASRRAESEE